MKPTNHKNTPEPKRGGIRGTKWKDPPPRRPKKPLKRVNHKENIKFLNPLLSQEAYPIRKGKDFLRGRLT